MTERADSSSGTYGHDGYVMDAENAAEMARLMLQDTILTRAMGGVLPEQTNISEIHDVLDIACGPGGWLLDLIQQYPSKRGVGIDISRLMTDYARSLAASRELSNVTFYAMDATKPLQFPDNSFDLVNGRIFTGFLSTHNWPKLLQECNRITRPGGIIRLTEPEWGFTNSAAYDTLTRYSTQALHRAGHTFSPHGRTIGTGSVLRLLLKQAGYQDVQNRAHAVDYSAGTQDQKSHIQDHLIVHKQLQPFFVKMQVATQEELERLHAQMEEELFAEDFCGIDYFLTVWARKP